MAEEYYFQRLGKDESFHKIASGEHFVGRDLHAMISCTSSYVSRKHLVVIRKLYSDKIHIKDLNTANGTYVNQKRIAPGKMYELKENDIITLGLQEEIPDKSYMFKLVRRVLDEPILIVDDSDDELDKTVELLVLNKSNESGKVQTAIKDSDPKVSEENVTVSPLEQSQGDVVMNELEEMFASQRSDLQLHSKKTVSDKTTCVRISISTNSSDIPAVEVDNVVLCHNNSSVPTKLPELDSGHQNACSGKIPDSSPAPSVTVAQIDVIHKTQHSCTIIKASKGPPKKIPKTKSNDKSSSSAVVNLIDEVPAADDVAKPHSNRKKSCSLIAANSKTKVSAEDVAKSHLNGKKSCSLNTSNSIDEIPAAEVVAKTHSKRNVSCSNISSTDGPQQKITKTDNQSSLNSNSVKSNIKNAINKSSRSSHPSKLTNKESNDKKSSSRVSNTTEVTPVKLSTSNLSDKNKSSCSNNNKDKKGSSTIIAPSDIHNLEKKPKQGVSSSSLNIDSIGVPIVKLVDSDLNRYSLKRSISDTSFRDINSRSKAAKLDTSLSKAQKNHSSLTALSTKDPSKEKGDIRSRLKDVMTIFPISSKSKILSAVHNVTKSKADSCAKIDVPETSKTKTPKTKIIKKPSPKKKESKKKLSSSKNDDSTKSLHPEDEQTVSSSGKFGPKTKKKLSSIDVAVTESENKNIKEPNSVVNAPTHAKIMKIPRQEPSHSKAGMMTRRRSVLEDAYESSEPKPMQTRRKSVSFLLDEKEPPKNYRRSSSAVLRPILKQKGGNNIWNIADWLNFLIHIIVRWNPVWIKEHSKMKADNKKGLPPIFHNGVSKIPLLTYMYKDIQQYVTCFTNLVVLEIWELVYTTMINAKTVASVNASVVGSPVFGSDKICKISCKCKEILNESTKKIIGHGTMCIVKFPSLSKREYFALIEDFDMKSGFKEIKITLFTKVNVDYQKKICDKLPFVIKPIVSIRNEMMLVKAIHALESSSLSNIIIAPKESYFTNFKSVSPLQWSHDLNPSQIKAVQQCVCAISSGIPNIQLIHGPPGTGKSRVITALVLEHLKRNHRNKSKKKILICSQTNIAIDEIIKRLLDSQQQHKAENLFNMVRVGRYENMSSCAQTISTIKLAKEFKNSPEMYNQVKILKENIEQYKKKMHIAGPQGAYSKMQHDAYKKKLNNLYSSPDVAIALQKEEMTIVQKADVIASTLQGCSLSKLQSLHGNIAFCIVDEAAKALEPEVLIPLSLGVECLIMVGDNQQLPGFIYSQEAKTKGFNESMFSRLIHSMGSWSNSSVLKLDTQYRMADNIVHFPNLAFYDGLLKNGVTYPPLPPTVPEYRVVHVPSDDCVQGNNGANIYEAKVVSQLALAIKDATKTENLDICILTPYNGQKDEIQIQLKKLSCSDMEVYTVDNFQGQEQDVIIISLARSTGLGFLIDPGRMAVLLTRAKRSCIVCCNPDFVKGQPLWESFLTDAKNRNMERKLPKNVLKNSPQKILELIR